MAVEKENSLSMLSSNLSQYDNSSNTESLHTYAKNQLKSRIFLGRYIERRLVSEKVGYRDIVLISAAEVELKQVFEEVQHKLRTYFPRSCWVGITDTTLLGYNPGLCLWSKLDGQPLGAFWFQIKTVVFQEDEIYIKLRCLRHITDSFLELEPLLTRGTKQAVKHNQSNITENSTTVPISEVYTDFISSFKAILTVTNVTEFFTFLFAFIIAIFSGSIAFVNFLGTFIISLMRELSMFVKNSTPLFLGVLDFFSKIVGGFYILLAMMFRSQTPLPPLANKRIGYSSNRRSRGHEGDYEQYTDFD